MEIIDSIDRSLLAALCENARAPLKDLAARVGLSSPSVAERLRRLEERGIIRGYTIDIDPKALGLAIEAIVRVRPAPGQLHSVQRLIEDSPAVVECDKVTGDDCFVARIHASSVEAIDAILDRIAEKASTSTAVVKSKTLRRRAPPTGR
jgi:Lrp/AsnC family leucine-responsive transcriptional regulator